MTLRLTPDGEPPSPFEAYYAMPHPSLISAADVNNTACFDGGPQLIKYLQSSLELIASLLDSTGRCQFKILDQSIRDRTRRRRSIADVAFVQNRLRQARREVDFTIRDFGDQLETTRRIERKLADALDTSRVGWIRGYFREHNVLVVNILYPIILRGTLSAEGERSLRHQKECAQSAQSLIQRQLEEMQRTVNVIDELRNGWNKLDRPIEDFGHASAHLVLKLWYWHNLVPHLKTRNESSNYDNFEKQWDCCVVELNAGGRGSDAS